MPKALHKSNLKDRPVLMLLLATLIIFGYIARLFYLQIVSNEYTDKAKRNAFYYRVQYPARGAIFDRNGKLVVYNEPAYDIMVTMHDAGDFDTTAFCSLLGIDRDYLRSRFVDLVDRKKNPGYTPYAPQPIVSQLTPEYAGRFQEQLFRFPGFSVRQRSTRRYTTPNAAHILGYLGECSRNELEADSALSVGDYVGKSGVEMSYEKELRGKKGYEVLLRDARGRIQGKYNNGLDDVPNEAGKNIDLSIDIDLQVFGEKLMSGKRGAIVAIEPSTGQVLALVSSPGFDPLLLSGKNLSDNYRILQTSVDKPLINRAIMGTYPPGSTFKAAQGAMLLGEGIITPDTHFPCYRGYPPLHNKPACHGHASPLSIQFAIATSCNAFFCWGLRSMIDDRSRFPSTQIAFTRWKDDMVDFGFGYRLGIDLPGERRGYIPNSEVFDKIYKKHWNSSTIISVAIGQGEVTATPLQIANLAATVANRGYYYKPHIVRNIQGGSIDTAYLHRHVTSINRTAWNTIADGMQDAVLMGTCRGANFAPGEIVVCGKTGTAQNPHGRDHSAFMGFAPKDNPRIAIAVYVENGGFGATNGVPIGRLMMEYYLKKGELSPYSQALAAEIEKRRIAYGQSF